MTMVFTNGCFDLFHPGHSHSLTAAKKFGDYLVVAINSDDWVRRVKGPGRPIYPLSERMKMVMCHKAVGEVAAFDTEDDLQNLIEKVYKPNVLVKGSEWRGKAVTGKDWVIANGGKMRYIEPYGEYRTTHIISQILNLFEKERWVTGE